MKNLLLFQILVKKHSLIKLGIANISDHEQFVEHLALLNEPTNDDWQLFITKICPEGYGHQNQREWRVKLNIRNIIELTIIGQ